MAGIGAPRRDMTGDPGLFSRIGAFLAEHRLSADPANYAFAHAVLEYPASVVAQSVTRLTDGGFRLSGQDIERLGGTPAAGAPVRHAPPQDTVPQDAPADTGALMARTQMQVEGLAHTIEAIHAETGRFGRDLEASAAELTRDGMAIGIDRIARLTAGMIARVHDAEGRLARATEESARLRTALDEAQGKARRDPLTDLVNRRGFGEATAAVPADAATIVALCDIDHFKRVNDQFGHSVGDRVLRAIAQALSAGCEGHLVARHGGEEFAVLMTGVSLEAAATILDTARDAIAGKRYRLRDTDALLGAVTLSIGVAERMADEPIDRLFDRADSALYRAKDDGRNRLRIAPTIGG